MYRKYVDTFMVTIFILTYNSIPFFFFTVFTFQGQVRHFNFKKPQKMVEASYQYKIISYNLEATASIS